MSETNQIDIDQIITNSLIGNIDSDEQKILNEWLSKSEKNRKLFDQLKICWRTRYQEPKYINGNQLKERIVSEGFNHQKRRSFTFQKVYQLARVAAILVFVIGSVLLINNLERAEVVDPEILVEKYNAPGIKSRIVLSDGSVVWLNADSRLTYKKDFSKDQRLIELSGEAFFEVKPDALRPFIVKSGLVQTTALGTSFNIRHYKEMTDTDISLFTGKVSVSTGAEDDQHTFFLEPNERLSISEDLTRITKTTFSGTGMASWKDNIIRFENASFREVVRTLERWYAVNIDASGYKKRDWNYVGEFSNESLERVLQRIGYAQDFDFTIEGDKARIFEK